MASLLLVEGVGLVDGDGLVVGVGLVVGLGLASVIVILFGVTVVVNLLDTSLNLAFVKVTWVVPTFFALKTKVNTSVLLVIPLDKVVSNPAII